MRCVLLAALFACLIPAALLAGWKKPYFRATTAGSWAKYTTHSTVGEMTMVTTRMPDADGKERVEIHTDFGKSDTPPSTVRYTLKKGFSLQNDAIDYTQAADGGEYAVSEGEVTPFEPEVMANIVQATPRYGDHVVFQGTETIDGKSCDHYTYTIKHSGDPAITETGELWMSDAVPFGVVRQKATLKEPNGTVRDSYEETMTNWGTK